MLKGSFTKLIAVAALAVLHSHVASARNTVTITFSRHSKPSYVQRLNQDGVLAVQKHDLAKAAELFYRAYLYDPADPFTLNNLGYVSELQGQLDRAAMFYKLASEQGSNASIELSNVKNLEGKPMNAVFANLQEAPMRINRINVDAVRLLSENRGSEAASLLEEALSLDPHNPYTLNNLGVANEALGKYDTALKYYAASADSASTDPIVVTDQKSWLGRPMSEMAAENARELQGRMRQTNSAIEQADTLNLRGVLAINQNDWPSARKYFLEAYTLNPSSAFSLNNRGYVAEKEGDLESAQFFYEKAWKGDGASLRVELATAPSAEGKPLVRVAAESNQKVDEALDAYSRKRREEPGVIELVPRGSAPHSDSDAPERHTSPRDPSAPSSSAMPQTPKQ